MNELLLHGVVLHWIDIEDEPEWGDEHDITSFPMVVIRVDGHTVFAGSVEPNIPQIRRLLLSFQHNFPLR